MSEKTNHKVKINLSTPWHQNQLQHKVLQTLLHVVFLLEILPTQSLNI